MSSLSKTLATALLLGLASPLSAAPIKVNDGQHERSSVRPFCLVQTLQREQPPTVLK